VNVEQRLVNALRSAEPVEPSTDLWARVVHSIEEDRAHRRRVVRSVGAAIGVLAVLVVVGWLGLTDGEAGSFVRPAVMEAIETIALLTIVAVVGPAIRRFGRGYAADLWPASPGTATQLLRLLDVAYFLVFAGFILLTADFDFTALAELCGLFGDCVTLQHQIQDALGRTGGLLLVMGLLHASTIMVLPIVALVSNSTTAGRPLPRWVVVLLVLMGLGVGFVLLNGLIGLGAS
jgi:hypothetical protein